MHQQNVTRNGFELFIFIELVDRLWKATRNAPQRRPTRQKGGRQSALTSPSMARAARNFLNKHSKETSRFCSAKQRHQQARAVKNSWKRGCSGGGVLARHCQKTN